MRPNSPYQQQLVRSIFHGNNRVVYSVPAGTKLPDHLVMVHERTDHYSLQPAKEMLLEGGQYYDDALSLFLHI